LEIGLWERNELKFQAILHAFEWRDPRRRLLLKGIKRGRSM